MPDNKIAHTFERATAAGGRVRPLGNGRPLWTPDLRRVLTPPAFA